MKNSPEFASFVADLLAPLGDIAVSRFFSGHQFRTGNGDEQIAMALGGTLYFRIAPEMRAEIEAAGGEPFTYEGQKKKVTVGRYVSAPGAWLDDPVTLLDFARRNLAALLSM